MPHKSPINMRPMFITGIRRLLPLLLLSLASCVSVKTEHRVEPIHITMDVNVRLEHELNDAFSELDARSLEIAQQKGSE
ncbi:MAG: hypothetical protein NWT02_07545 [Opitutales bacterium]|nr:hypothetical protein [Opitutales bacterium]MDP4645463.1 hypothetical protein [Opitutales bacterium]MDP4778217.1 hypothetical protein [Opitutales bacterium]MDP4883680.1 hypothetical protein [Opitutales bacterium]